MFSLTIEQKILLAEEVMGWKYFNDASTKQTCIWYDVVSGVLVYRIKPNRNWLAWRPEIDEGDAARLLMSLPIVQLHKFGDGSVKAYCTSINMAESNSFCETICRLALAYAEELKQ